MYIGKSNNPERRLVSHFNEDKRHNYCKFEWLKKLRSLGLRPELLILERVSDKRWRDSEQFWISYFNFIGSDLVNLAAGGDGPSSLSLESRVKMSRSLIGRIFTEEHKQKISSANKGRVNGSERNANISKALKASYALNGHPMSGTKRTNETKFKIGESRKGKLNTDETKMNMSLVKRGNKNPMFGKTHSDETKIKQSEKRKLYHSLKGAAK